MVGGAKLKPACSPFLSHAKCSPRMRRHVRPTRPQASGHVRWAQEIAQLPNTPSLVHLIKVLQAQGQTLVAPEDTSGLNPLLIPLTEHGGAVTCLLRWPEQGKHKDIELPVVVMSRNAPTLTMLARSPEEYMHRALAEEDSREGSNGAVAAAAGTAGHELYEAGAYSSSGLPDMGVYLTRKAGMYPDVCESLALKHWDKGDTMSALITAEWYMRRLPGWGRPFEFGYQLLQRAGRPEESRDTARVGLRMPWWSFQEGFAGLRDAAGFSGGSAEVRSALDDMDNMSNGEVLQGMYKTNPKTEKQLLMERAEWLMNQAAAGEVGWDKIRADVADSYSQAGLISAARFITATL